MICMVVMMNSLSCALSQRLASVPSSPHVCRQTDNPPRRDRKPQNSRPRARKCQEYKKKSTEVEGIQGSGPQIVFWGAFSPNSPDHGDLRAVSPPPLINIKM